MYYEDATNPTVLEQKKQDLAAGRTVRSVVMRPETGSTLATQTRLVKAVFGDKKEKELRRITVFDGDDDPTGNKHVERAAAGTGDESRTMRKRLRKKRRLGEFRESIFGVRFSLRDGLAVGADDEFLWRFLDEAIEANGLLCGGGRQGAAWEFYVQLARRGSPSEAQRTAVGAWLAQQPEVEMHELGGLFDGWHGPEEAPYTGPQVRLR